MGGCVLSKHFEERLAAFLIQLLLFLPAIWVTENLDFWIRASFLTGFAGLAVWGACGSRNRRATSLAVLRWVFLTGSAFLMWRAGTWFGRVSNPLAIAGQVSVPLTWAILFLVMVPFGRSFWLGCFNARFPETASADEMRKYVRMENSQPVSPESA